MSGIIRKTVSSPDMFFGSFDNLFDSFTKASRKYEVGFNPRVEIVDNKDQIVIKAEVPGLSRDDMSIDFDGDMLILKGEKRREHEQKDENSYISEISYGSFQRSFNLPKNIDMAKINANYTDGVLQIILPRKEDAKPVRISIGSTVESQEN